MVLRVVWVPRAENVYADELSKWVDGSDYVVSGDVFAVAEREWGPHEVDRFASHTAHVLPVFNSQFHCPGTAGVDAPARSWGRVNNWVHPPVGLVGAVLGRMLRDGCKGTLLVPHWPKQPRWPLLQPQEGRWAPFVVGAKFLPSLQRALRSGASGAAGLASMAGAGFLLRLDCSHPRIGALLPVKCKG